MSASRSVLPPEQIAAEEEQLRQCDQVVEGGARETTGVETVDRCRQIGHGNAAARLAPAVDHDAFFTPVNSAGYPFVNDPPSIAIVSPLIERAWSEARNTAAAAISAAATDRFIGITPNNSSRVAGSSSSFVNGVPPGRDADDEDAAAAELGRRSA
jgi:hypothetical protein